jgi:hypothetical protein
MFGLLDYLKLGAGAVVGAVLTVMPAYYYGKHEGRQEAAVAALTASVKAVNSRNEINEDISASDAARLCADFGLSDDDRSECVRRMGEAASKPGNEPVHPEERPCVLK